MPRAIAPWPWISPLLAALVSVSPPGRDFLWSAFISNEQLSRSIARPLVFWALGAALIAMLCEYLLRKWLRRS